MPLGFVMAAVLAAGLTPDYPKLPRSDVREDFHGVTIADPFRWLEDPAAAETRDFIAKENALTEKWIPAAAAAAYRARLEGLMDYPKRSMPSRQGPWWITMRNAGLQKHYVMFRQRGEDGPAEVLLDPNTFSKDGTVALASTAFTEDGALLAYGKSVGGSDEQTIFVRDVATGEDRADRLERMRFSNVAWAPDNSGFWYNKFPDPDRRANSTIYWHRLGDPQSRDRAVFSRPSDPELDLGPAVTEDGRYLVVYATRGTDRRNAVWLREIAGEPAREGGFRAILPSGRAEYGVVGNDGATFYVYTDDHAPKRRLIALDVNRSEEPWRELIPAEDALLRGVTMVGESFVAEYSRDVSSELRIHGRDGRLRHAVTLPQMGSISGVSGRREDEDFFFGFSNYTTPGTIYRCDLASGKWREFDRSRIHFDADRYVTERAFCVSPDGTRIPLWIARRRDLPRDGKNPALLYGYGGFSISLEPGFSPTVIPWLEQGGIFAVANLRGGGEYGTEWHEAGMLGRKQNVFDDFRAAARKLVADGWTTPEKLAIEGGSNGGLLTAAVVLQWPEQFGAVLSHVPVIDMFRYQRFGTGRYWTVEYGDATANREAFDWLRRYSPLHNVKAGQKYPPILVTTADGDDRVVPAHAFKFVATLQAEADPGVYLLRHEVGAGHGGGKPLDRQLDEKAACYAFLTRALGLPAPDFSGSEPKKPSAAPKK